jgi:hypothetical protein
VARADPRGFRRLRERDYYRDDPLVQRVLGLRRLPDVSTWTRGLAEPPTTDVAGMQALNREVVTDRIRKEQLRRVTADFEGSVLSTRGHAEGSAVGFTMVIPDPEIARYPVRILW